MPKISGAILDLAKDRLDLARNKSQRKTSITAACTAWNIAVLVPEDHHYEEINNFFKTEVDDTEVQALFTRIMLSMIEKKKWLHPDDQRVVVNYEIVDTKKYFSINVAAMLPP